MGSGHILVYAFDVLMQIYEAQGYTQRDAAQLIVEKNLYGLDIDKRAYQLAYFAVMMKARQYNRRILNGELRPHLYAIQDSNGINRNQLQFFGWSMGDVERNKALTQVEYLLDTFRDAKEYGSSLGQRLADGRIPHAQIPSLFLEIFCARLHLDQRFLRFCFRQKHFQVCIQLHLPPEQPVLHFEHSLPIPLGDHHAGFQLLSLVHQLSVLRQHLLNHINSTRRSKLGGKTPFELADSEEFLKLKEVMGLKAIPADEVDLTPRLLRKK